MRLARLVLILMLALAFTPVPVRAGALDRVGDADRIEIRTIIERQLAAFQRDDGATAFAFASPTIRAIFGTPENFMAMVRDGYAPVYRPREVEFQDLADIDGVPTQRVLLVGPDGRVVVAHYFMQRQADGTWRINGCVLKGVAQTTS